MSARKRPARGVDAREPVLPAATMPRLNFPSAAEEPQDDAASIEQLPADAAEAQAPSEKVASPRKSSPRKKAGPSSSGPAAATRKQRRQEPSAAPEPTTTPGERPRVNASVSAQVTVRYPEELFARMTAFTADNGLSQRTVVLDAVESGYKQLRERFAPTGDKGAVSLFQRGRSLHRGRNTNRVLRSIALTHAERDTLAQVAADLGAASMHELIVTALDRYLPRPSK